MDIIHKNTATLADDLRVHVCNITYTYLYMLKFSNNIIIIVNKKNNSEQLYKHVPVYSPPLPPPPSLPQNEQPR